jgi:hypothetical protein
MHLKNPSDDEKDPDLFIGQSGKKANEGEIPRMGCDYDRGNQVR